MRTDPGAQLSDQRIHRSGSLIRCDLSVGGSPRKGALLFLEDETSSSVAGAASAAAISSAIAFARSGSSVWPVGSSSFSSLSEPPPSYFRRRFGARTSRPCAAAKTLSASRTVGLGIYVGSTKRRDAGTESAAAIFSMVVSSGHRRSVSRCAIAVSERSALSARVSCVQPLCLRNSATFTATIFKIFPTGWV